MKIADEVFLQLTLLSSKIDNLPDLQCKSRANLFQVKLEENLRTTTGYKT